MLSHLKKVDSKMIRGQSGGSGSPGKPHWLLLQNTKEKRKMRKKEKVGKKRKKEKQEATVADSTKYKIRRK